MPQRFLIAAGLAWVLSALVLLVVRDDSATVVKLLWYPAALVAIITPVALLLLIARLFDEMSRMRDLVAREALERKKPQMMIRPPAAKPEPQSTGGPRAAAAPAESDSAEGQSHLPFGDDLPRSTRTMAADDLITAINFPSDESDLDGIRAMRQALADPVHGQTILACQDVLTLLGQDGIYMDQSTVTGVRASHWRRYADGIRGSDIAPLARIASPELVAHLTARMRTDTIFRDAMQHFLRLFDKMLVVLIPTLSDGALDRLTETRSARAFMLLGAVAGVFGLV